MGAADVVPGVSGGTIAFVGGIYDELLKSIRAISWSLFGLWKKSGLKAVYQQINASFLLALGFGILTSIFSLARIVTGLLETQPILLWSFFFGLVLASTFLVIKKVSLWNIKTYLALFMGALGAYLLMWIEPAQGAIHLLGIFLAAMVAISAMILPGISGSFILLLLGVYSPVLEAVKNFEIVTILVFGLGCILGLLSFVRCLSWLLSHYRALTLATLTGFMLGSLSKVWPWKQVLSSITNHKGQEIPIKEACLFPSQYQNLLGEDPFLGRALLTMGFGIILIFFIHFLSLRTEKKL